MRFTAFVVLLLSAVNAAWADVSMEEIRKEFDAGKYSSAIVLTSQALSARGPEAEKLDRYALLYLRGEALLKLKQAKYAEQAFEEAFADGRAHSAASILQGLSGRAAGCSGVVYGRRGLQLRACRPDRRGRPGLRGAADAPVAEVAGSCR